jgi:hypothetical protein
LSRNTTGEGNIAFGNGALTYSTTSSNNIAIGRFALNKLVGSNNTAIGIESGQVSAVINAPVGNGANNTFLGYRSGRTVKDGNNNIMIGANTNPNVGIDASNQLNIGNWIYGSGGLIGIGAAAAIPTERLDIGGNATAGSGGLRVRNINSAAYTGAATDRVVVADANGVLKTIESGKLSPQFFYAPSMVMPTVDTDLPNHTTYSAGTFTVDMYAIYNAQFGMTGDVAGVNRTAIKSAGAGVLDVVPANGLGYFVIYFDNTVYDPTSIALTADGKLSYKILPGAIITVKTYMNIVFKVK